MLCICVQRGTVLVNGEDAPRLPVILQNYFEELQRADASVSVAVDSRIRNLQVERAASA